MVSDIDFIIHLFRVKLLCSTKCYRAGRKTLKRCETQRNNFDVPLKSIVMKPRKYNLEAMHSPQIRRKTTTHE